MQNLIIGRKEEIALLEKQQLGGNNNGHLGDLLTYLVYCDFLRAYKVREKIITTFGLARGDVCRLHAGRWLLVW